MSNVIDNRVVQMQFDNQQFERGVKQSMNSLNQLDKSLKGIKQDNGASALSSALNSVQSALSKINPTRWTWITELNKGIMKLGSTIMNKLVSPLSIMKEGGMTRAMNIEQARFQFEGLGMDIDQAMASATAAVNDTAYGLDSAAKAAAMLGTSGMQAGEDMTKALTAISGVTAQVNGNYDDIANIFTDISSAGRLTGDALTRLSYRGINAAAELGKAMGKSEADIKKLASQGKISFKQFYEAMYDAFGEHAYKANETYQGSLDNLHAALKKIGADFGQYKLKEFVDLHNAARLAVNKLRKELSPVAAEYGRVLHVLVQFAKVKLDGIDARPLSKIFEGIANIIARFIDLANVAKHAFQEMFPNTTVRSFDSIASAFLAFTERIQISGEAMETFKDIFKGFIAFWDILHQVILGVAKALLPGVESFQDLAAVILGVLRIVGRGLVVLDEWIRENDLIVNSVNTVKNVLIAVVAVIAGLVIKLVELVKQLRNSEIVVSIINKLSSAFNKFKSIFKSFTDTVSSTSKASQFKAGKSGGGSSQASGIFGWLINQLNTLTAVVKKVIGEITPAKVIIAGFVAFIAGIAIAFTVAVNKLSNGVKQTGGALNNFWNAYMKFTKKMDDKGKEKEKKEKFRHFIEIAGLMTALAFALKGLAAQPLPNILVAVTGMGAIIYELWKVMGDVAKTPNKEKVEKNLKAMKGVALIMAAIGVALSVAARQDWASLAATGVAMTMCMSAVTRVIDVISKIDSVKITATIDTMGKMSAVVAAFPVIANSLKKLQKMDPGTIVAAAAGMSACILAIGKTIDIMSNIKDEGISMQKVAAILAVCVGANLIGIALAVAAKRNWAQLGIAALAIIGTLGVMVGVVAVLAKIGESGQIQNMLAASASLLIATVSLLPIANALSQLTFYNWDQMWQTTIAMAATLVAMGGVLAALTALSIGSEGIGAVVLLAVAAAIIAMGKAMEMASKGVLMISQALAILQNVALDHIAAGMLVLVGAIENFPVMKTIGLAAACVLGGNGFLAFARGIQEFAAADLSGLASNISTLFDAIAQSSTSFVEVGANLTALGVGLNVIAEAVQKAGLAMVPLGIGLAIAGVGVLAVGAGLRLMAPALELMQTLDWDTLGTGLASVGDGVAKLAVAGVAISLASTGLVAGAIALGAIAAECWAFTKINLLAVAKGLATIATAGIKIGAAGIAMGAGAVGIGAMAVAIYAIGKATASCAQLVDRGVKITVNSLLLLKQVGSNIISGLAQGISNGLSTIAKVAANLGLTVLNSICKVLDIHSPSGALRAVGEFTGSGFILGIADTMDEAEKSGKSLGMSAILGTESLSGMAQKAGQALGLDFSNGFEGVINSLLGGVRRNFAKDGANGMPSAVASKMSKTGLNAVSNSLENLLGLNLDLDKSFGDLSKSAGGAGSALEGLGDSAGKAGKGVKDAKNEITDFVKKMEDSFNILEEFDLGLDEENPLTGDKLIANMQSNIDGMATWASEMLAIAGKVPEGLYKKLADMGPQGYKYVHAFAQMTEEQLQQVQMLYATSLVIPTNVTAMIYSGMNEAANNAYTGFVNGLNIPQMQKDGITMATTFIGGLKTGLDSHSPSKKTYSEGVNAALGLSDGLKSPTSIGVVKIAVEDLCRAVLDTFKNNLNAREFVSIGKSISDGLTEGIEQNEGKVGSAIARLCAKVKEVAKSKNRGLDVNSPSKIFIEIGKFVDEGLAKGISDNVDLVESSVSKMADQTVNNMRGAIETIQTIADSDLNVEPVIRPVVDLSNVQNGANSINSLMGMNFGTNVTMPAASFMTQSELINNSDNTAVVAAVNSLKDDVVSLKDAITNMKIMLDSGTMVGAMTPMIDQQLGMRQVYAGRGI